jgi:dodecin
VRRESRTSPAFALWTAKKSLRKQAVETATKTLRDLRIAEVNKLDLVIIDGKVAAFRVRVNLWLKYEEKD